MIVRFPDQFKVDPVKARPMFHLASHDEETRAVRQAINAGESPVGGPAERELGRIKQVLVRNAEQIWPIG